MVSPLFNQNDFLQGSPEPHMLCKTGTSAVHTRHMQVLFRRYDCAQTVALSTLEIMILNFNLSVVHTTIIILTATQSSMHTLTLTRRALSEQHP